MAPGYTQQSSPGFRLLVDAHGKPLFTLQELAMLVGSTNRQAASQHLEDFRQCGEDMRAFVLHKRKVDTIVVEDTMHELLQTPLAGSTELVLRVNARLGRDDLTVANIESALEQISCVLVLRTLRRQDERTVRRRLAWLRARAPEWRIIPWVTAVEAKLPRLICSVGSVRLLLTTNAIERFFRAFQRFYRPRGAFTRFSAPSGS